MKKYRIHEVFFSLQGEGVRAGTAAVFVRFAGCNLKCTVDTVGFDCDTDYYCRMELTAEELWNLIEKEWADRPGERWVIFTGGEPALQLDRELLNRWRMLGRFQWNFAIETNGTVDSPVFLEMNWVTISPKPGHPVKLDECDELKLVVGGGCLSKELVVIVESLHETIEADHWLFSPAFNGLDPDPVAISRCVTLVQGDPRWRLSLQIHKFIGVR